MRTSTTRVGQEKIAADRRSRLRGRFVIPNGPRPADVAAMFIRELSELVLPMTFRTRFAIVVIVSLALCDVGSAQPRRTQSSQPPSGIPTEAQIRDRLNAWAIGLAGGLLEGAPIRFATDIARVVNDGGVMHVLPIVTRGPTENVNDLLYLKGVDAAIINSNSLEEYKSQVPQIQQRIKYIISLFPSELHVFVRPEIGSLQDLVGKKVNFNTQGTAAAYSGPLIFSRLGLEVEKMFIPHPVALEQLRRGEIAGVVFVTSKPVDAFLKGRWDAGYKFLPVEYGSKFEDYYLPSDLELHRLSKSDRQGREDPHDCCTHHPHHLQLARRLGSVSARCALCRRPLQPGR